MFASRQLPPPARDWYFSASPEDRREYDAFGPWVQPVAKEDDMPPRFRSAWSELCDARFLLKLPIRADRRDVRPGMDLYDAVIAASNDGLIMLRLAEDGVARTAAAWDQIVGLSSFSDLLYGRWSLLFHDGRKVELFYNTVSAHRFTALGEFVRARIAGAADSADNASAPPSQPIADLFYRNQARTVRAADGGPARVLHVEPRERLCREPANRRRLSTGIAVLDAGDGLVTITRGAPVRRLFHPDYSAHFVFLPYSRLSGFAVQPASGRGHFTELVLQAAAQTHTLFCLDRPDSVIALIEARGVRGNRG